MSCPVHRGWGDSSCHLPPHTPLNHLTRLMNKNGENVAASVMLGPGSVNKEAVTDGLLSHFIISAGAKWRVTPGRL